jgi:hypothetical protein
MKGKCPTPTIESIYGAFAPFVRQFIGLKDKATTKDLDGGNEEDKNQDKKESDKNNDSVVKEEVDNDNSNVQQQHKAQPARQEEQNLPQQPVQRLLNASEDQLVATTGEAEGELPDGWCVVECRLGGSVGKHSIDDDE